MNVIVSNKYHSELSNLDIDVIKSISGEFDAYELVEMFKSFFFNKMILDVTALKNYEDIRTYEVLVSGLEPDKIIFLLPEGSKLCTPSFLSRLISIKIYNFTTNINGVKYLLKKTNTLKDVENIVKMANMKASSESGAAVAKIPSSNKAMHFILGIKNVTVHAGATTFTYLLKRELSLIYGRENVVALEINRDDFYLFNEANMFSIRDNEINTALSKYSSAKVILVDLNDSKDIGFCNDIIYLIEPSTIKLNKLVRTNRSALTSLVNKHVILNKSLLLNNDVFEFEHEAGIKIIYNMPPLDERKRNSIIHDFLNSIGLITDTSNDNDNSSKIFGLFRR